MNRPAIEIGANVTHPSVNYPLYVFDYHYTTAYDPTRLGQKSEMTYSGQVRCMRIDEQGIEHKYYLFPAAELTVIG